MISTDRFVALCSLAGALGFHLIGVMAIDLDEDALMDAMAGANTAALGTGFEDLAVGTFEAQAAEGAAATPSTETAEHATAGVSAIRQDVDRLRPESVMHVQPVQTGETVKRTEAQNASPLTAKPEVQDRLEPVTTTRAATAVPISKSVPIEMAALPPKTPRAVKQPPLQAVEAQEPEKGAVSQSKRPKLRTRERVLADPEPKAQPKPTAQSKTKSQAVARSQAPAPPKRGNAQQATRKGAVTGNESAQASTQGVKKGTGTASGNAQVSNYPGLVMRKIQRVRRPAVGARGTAVIAFKVGANGGLSAVSVARSSGSAKLDQAAVKVVRKAAPFPKPPAGARRSFSIKIKGR